MMRNEPTCDAPALCPSRDPAFGPAVEPRGGWWRMGLVLAVAAGTVTADPAWQQLATVQQPVRAARQGLRAVAFSPDERLLAAGGEDGMVTVWQVSSGEPMARWRCLEGNVLCLAFAPDSRHLVCGGGWPAQQAGALAVWDAESQRLVRALPWGSQGVVRAQGLSLDGSLLAAGGGQGVVAVWQTGDWSLAGVWRPHQAEVSSLAAGPEGWWTGDAEGVILCWSDRDGTIATRWELPEAGGVMALARASDAMLLATAHASDQSLRLWDLQEKRPLAVRYNRTGLIRGVALWPQGKMAASGGGLRSLAGQLVLTTADGGEMRSLPGHGNIISCLSLSRSGRWLASADADGQLLLWDAQADWQPRRLLPR